MYIFTSMRFFFCFTKRYLLLSSFFFFVTAIAAQEFKIFGVVKDLKGETLEYANVVLLNAKDSTTIEKGTTTNEFGKFTFKEVSKGIYFIEASYISNNSIKKKIQFIDDFDAGILTIKENAQELEEVVIHASLPTVEHKVDRLVFTIENTALTDSDIWDVLKRTPSILIIQDKLTIKGSINVTVLINDRKVNLPKSDIINLLSGTAANNVKAIEVITNPPGKYSAEDGVLINIKMKKNLVAGYNGMVYNSYKQGVFPKHTVGTDHYFKGNKTGFSANYSFTNKKDIIRYTDITNFFQNDGTTEKWTADQAYTKRQKKHIFSAFFDYEMDENNRLSLSTISSWNPKGDRFHNTKTTIENNNNILESSFNTLNNANSELLNTSYYLDFRHKLKREGAELSFNSHYTFYDNSRKQVLETDFLDENGVPTGQNNFSTNSNQGINIYSVQVDYNTPFGKKSIFETGIRYAGINSENTIEQEGFDRDQPGINPTEVGEFKYDEAIYAAYLGYSTKWDKWRLKGGLRGEYTQTEGVLDTEQKGTENNYFELFPSFSLQYTQSKKHKFKLYYYKKITRPRYSYINPFQFFQSNNVIVEGNPKLIPATRHYLAGGYIFDRAYTVELFYRNEKNPFRQLLFQDNTSNLLRFIYANIERQLSYGLDISVSKNFTNFWNSYLLLSIYNGEYKFTDLDSGQKLVNGATAYFLRTSNSFTFLKDRSLNLYIDFSYYSPTVVGNYKHASTSEFGIFLRKRIWNKKGSISMGLADIFNKKNIFNTRNFLNQNNSSLVRRENRIFSLGFRYKFGNQKIRNNKKRKRVTERNRL
ncbi:MAG: outer membrane beta-barrel family protein [Cellulophaga sp.]